MMYIVSEIYYFITWIISIVRGIRIGKGTIIRIPFSIKNPDRGGDGRGITLGDGCFIGQGSRLYCYTHPDTKKPGKICLGNYFCAQRDLLIAACTSVKIGDYVLLASNVMINDTDHGLVPGEKGFPYLSAKPIIIEDNCWLAENVCVLKGVTIGKYSIVGANSVVTRDIPPYSVAAGSPAKVVKRWNFDTSEWEKIRDLDG